jgi:hypothetical protein
MAIDAQVRQLADKLYFEKLAEQKRSAWQVPAGELAEREALWQECVRTAEEKVTLVQLLDGSAITTADERIFKISARLADNAGRKE